MIVISSLCVAGLVCIVAYKLMPPIPKLSKQLSPYDTVVRVRLDRSIEKDRVLQPPSFFLIEFFRPIYESFSKAVGKIAAIDDSETTLLRLEQAGLKSTVDEYRMNVVKKVATYISIGFLLGALLGRVNSILFFPLLFGFIGFSKSRATIDKLIEQRCITIRSEMYTIDQLLALYIRTGAGVTQALTSVSRRTHGIVSHDISVILSRIRSGMPIEDSLYLASKRTPEPHAMRTYKLLAAASQRGVDLTQGLLDLSKDLRRSLREEIKTSGAKRRAAMLVPTIGILAPIMLLFVAAPIPSIVLGGR